MGSTQSTWDSAIDSLYSHSSNFTQKILTMKTMFIVMLAVCAVAFAEEEMADQKTDEQFLTAFRYGYPYGGAAYVAPTAAYVAPTVKYVAPATAPVHVRYAAGLPAYSYGAYPYTAGAYPYAAVSTPVPTSVLLPSLPPPTSPEPTLTHTTTATLTLPSLLPRRKNRFFYSPQSASKRLPAKFPAKINMNRPIKMLIDELIDLQLIML